MKKYILTIVIIAFFIVSALTISVLQVQKQNTKAFIDEGYILQSKSNGQVQEVERYYFNANGTYKKQYNDKISFKDTAGEDITVEEANFLHYTNGSISSLAKGVILNLEDIDKNPILYYTVAANKVLKKSGNTYSIKNMTQELNFKNFIWKIADNKYLICGSPLTIHFQNGDEKVVPGYLELEYSDNEVVKLYNQELTYQTVSSNLFITLPNEIKINLSNKIVSKQNENKMSLENMVINSDDNVEIVNIEDEKYKEEKENTTSKNEITEENNTNDNNSNNNNNSNNSGNNSSIINQNGNSSNLYNPTGTIQNGQTTTIDTSTNQNGNTSITIDQNNNSGENDQTGEEEVTETPEILVPTFKVEEFDVDSISMDAKIAITDEESMLVGNPIIKILRNDTGKLVYENEETTGTFLMDVSVSSLMPDTEYTMVVQADYEVESIDYTKNFVYKIFRTRSAGIELEKDYFTDNTLAFKCNIDDDSKVSNADIVLMDMAGNVIETKKVDRESLRSVEFYGLSSNTNYVVQITNVLYGGQVITNGFSMSRTYKTLKTKPEISGTEFEIDKRYGRFFINVANIKDTDEGITNCYYEIYDTRQEGLTKDPILTISSNKNEQVTVPVDGIKIDRGVPYTFKLVANFFDNEKEVEFESEYSDIMKMDGVEFPTVRFEEKSVTFERIQGTLVIDDSSNTIDLSSNNHFTVIYTDSVGISQSFTASGSTSIPVSINGLRSNETYKFSVYTTVDLQDGNDPISECYIGGAVVRTKIPQDLRAEFEADEEDVKNTFKVSFKLRNAEETVGTLEADTLTSMTFSIFAGQSTEGAAIKTLKVVDTNTEPYVSELKDNYYDGTVELTPEFFGADNKDFKDKFYTITVTEAYDYTTYQNKIPIQKNVFTIETKGYRPDLPTNPDNAVEVTEIRNRDKDMREDLDASTIVGYFAKAKYNNSDLYARKVIYRAFDVNTGALVETKELDIREDGVIPEVEFKLGDGTKLDVEDTDVLRRGNSYYFTYEMLLDLNNDGEAETLYPYEDEIEPVTLRSPEKTPKKQEAKIQMYPSTSTNNSITYKYKITDIDNSLQDNQFTASIGSTVRDTEEIYTLQEGEDEYKEVTFSNLAAGELSITTYEAINKNEFATIRTITDFYFESRINLNAVRYRVDINSNRVVITLQNVNNRRNRISAITVEFKGTSKTITKDFLYPDLSNDTVVVSLTELEELIGQNVQVSVYAYYDTGLIGYDMESDYKLLQKAYKSGDTGYYLALNNENSFSYIENAVGLLYQIDREDNVLNIKDAINTSRTLETSLIKLEGGLAYEYEIINEKQVNRVAITAAESNIITFDLIIPGITLQDATGQLAIQSELESVEFKASIIQINGITIQNGTIYVEIYETDENGNNEKFVKTETKNISEFGDTITISNLVPKTYYYLKFKAVLVEQDGTTAEEYLYDMDYQVQGKNYYFSTLASVGISNISVKYNPVEYNQKTIDISYNLDRIFGYQKIVYTIQKWNEETSSYEIIFDNIEDTLFKREMLRQISSNPGDRWEFGKKYNLIIKPIAILQDESGASRELEVGTTEQEFELKTLNVPLIGIKGSRTSNDEAVFRITMYDTDKVVRDDEYSVKVFNSKSEDITPSEYVGKKYKTSLVNNGIRLENAERNQSYKIEVTTYVDLQNNGEDYTEFKKTYTILRINDSGISVGNITTTANDVQRNKIDLLFNDSYKLTEIDQIKYSIYNTNGYSINGTQDFIPVENIVNDETIYRFTIDENLRETGRYYIELQFAKDGNTVETYSLEHTYIEE